MRQAASTVRDLARQILAQEGDKNEPSETRSDADLRAFEKLRLHLSKLVGIAGFHALLTRSRTLAKAEVRWLESVQIKADGAFEGFRETARQQPAEAVAEGSETLMGQLLGLLITFIGEALTLRLVRDVWPDAALNDRNSGAEETSE